MKVKEFMTRKVEFIDNNQSVYDAVEKMVDMRIRSVLVRFSGMDQESGVITARDVVYKVLAKGLDPSTVRAKDAATRPLVCVDENVSLDEAASVMQERSVSRLFVCRSHQIVGIVSLMDVMAAELVKKARGSHVS